jgi:hypothetical protein
MNKYDSIINYDYKMKHNRMPISERSFEFAPFSALVGFKDLITERERETILKKEITDDIKDKLDYKLNIINNNLLSHPLVTITYFIKDNKKSGGRYENITNYIKKIDLYHKLIVLENKNRIKIDDIIDINSKDINLGDILD